MTWTEFFLSTGMLLIGMLTLWAVLNLDEIVGDMPDDDPSLYDD